MKALRWLAIWLLLTGTYLAGWVLTGWFLRGGIALDTVSLAGLAAVPLAQTAALRGLAGFRRMFRDVSAQGE
jgi:hypothetical protein